MKNILKSLYKSVLCEKKGDGCDYPDLCSIVIREQNERTKSLCECLVKKQTDYPIYTIHEKPFSKALKKGFEKGIECGSEWTICIDADILIGKETLHIISNLLHNIDTKVFRINPFGLHKFHGFAFPCAIHIYRTSLLTKALTLIPDSSESKRPESTVLREMNKLGYNYRCFPQTLALHECRLGYSDIYRRMVLRASKASTNEIQFLLNRCIKEKNDPDFQVAHLGLKRGLNNPISEHSIDTISSNEISNALKCLNLHEKTKINDYSPIDITEYVKTIGDNDCESYSKFYWDKYNQIYGNNFL